MRKILFLISLCALAFSAPRPTQDDFNACYEKNLPSIVNVAGHEGIALSPNLIAVVKKDEMPLRNYIKFDPFLGLYLVASDVSLDPIKMSEDNRTKKSDWVSVTKDINSTVYGHVKSLGERLGELDTLTFDVNDTTAVLSACCNLRGISVGGNKFIPNRYLRHFIAYPDVYYGDVGAIFEAMDGKFYVKSVEQLGRGQALMAKDEILSINKEKFKTLRELNERILFAKKGEILTFEIMRDGVVERFNIAVSDSASPKDKKSKDEMKPDVKSQETKEIKQANTTNDFFKTQGITLDTQLNVNKVDEGSKAANFGIKTGDKLIQVGKNQVKNRNDAIKLTSKNSAEHILLFRRNGFDFFYKAR
ncbi:PDZ domain-containing protein [Campylobacter sp. CCUG 57310]|uniref:DUF7488 domain-containing protein n=1 Tax=Campylobacter sp. CCUG 57310 TaxID=2517362 RepID=UPI001565D785|nr:PDZ domain-containing protein [Campylobacter sp. CCUG 57310]QKF91308.1 putative protease (PDZ domain) [Campylobacter sp. CCUG 57310]